MKAGGLLHRALRVPWRVFVFFEWALVYLAALLIVALCVDDYKEPVYPPNDHLD